MPVTGIGPVADGGTYAKWLGDTAGTSGIGPFASGDTYAQALGGGGGSLLGNIGSSFLEGLGGSGGLSNVFRLAGTVGGLLGPGVDIKDATKQLNKMSKRTTRKIDERIENIYPGLTGMTGEEALSKYYDAFANTVKDVVAQGRSDLTMDPDISKQYNLLNTRIDDIQNQYSLANRLGGYEKLALDPAVVSMDVGSIRKAADWTAPEIASQYGMMMDYSGPQASKFIYGNRGTADAVGRYYNSSGDVAGLMNYGTLA
jgi:hypothetical protein